MKQRLLAVLAVLGTALFCAAGTSAQVNTSAGVARISLIHGQVSTQRGDSGDWAAAMLNAPVVSGDKISTGADSRGEVQLDYADILRLSDQSQATVAGLSNSEIQVQVAQGIANYDTFKGGEASVEIDTPNAAVHPFQGEGSYRIAILPNGDTEVIVRKGRADVSTPQGSTTVDKGKMITVRGTDNNTEYQIADAPSKDSWDRWNSDRDDVIRNAQAWSHTDRYYTGAQDLDAYGVWSEVPDYGSVWIPAQGPGWVPYRAGRWVWEPYWGWTWVSYEPWGWAPYHYGRWFLYGSSWAWWPGPVYGGYGGFYRPIWAPAYVSFFGFGGGVGFGWGSVGWLPIGPCDYFHPWWGGYRNRFNVVSFNEYNRRGYGGFAPLHGGDRFSNLRMANNDPHFRGYISTMDAHHFGTGDVRARGLAPGEFSHGRLVAGNLPVVPSHQSLYASNRAAAPGTIHNGAPTHFFGRRPMVRQASFQNQANRVQTDIQHNSHFTPIRSEGAVNSNLRMNNSAERGSFGAAANRNDHGPQIRSNPTSPMGVNRAPQNARVNNAPADNNWRHFGGPAESGNRQANNVPRPGSNVRTNESPRSFNAGNNVPRPGNNGSQNARPADQGWRHFSAPADGGNRQFNNNVPRPNSDVRTNEAPRSFNNNVPRPGNNSSGNWRQFTPQSRSAPDARPGGEGNYSPRSYSQPERSYSPQRSYAQPEVNSGRSYSAPGRSYSRPPLDMRQPVVRSAPSYSGRSGGYSGGSRPSGGGSHGGGGGGSHGGGGGSHGGGGHHR